MKFSESRRQEASVNLTPLIDILFTVMMFLVVTATYADHTTLRVTRPRAATAAPVGGDPNVLRVGLDASGNILLAGEPIDLDRLRQTLTALPDPDRATVVLAADRAVNHGRVIEIVDAVRQAGIFRIDFETSLVPRL